MGGRFGGVSLCNCDGLLLSSGGRSQCRLDCREAEDGSGMAVCWWSRSGPVVATLLPSEEPLSLPAGGGQITHSLDSPRMYTCRPPVYNCITGYRSTICVVNISMEAIGLSTAFDLAEWSLDSS
jgi:hypothetical protein